MSEFNYYLWILYGFAALSLVFLAWYFLRRIRVGWLADALILLIAVSLLTPWLAVPGKIDLAPALFIFVFEAMLMENPTILRTGLPLAGVYGLVWLALLIKRRLLRRIKNP